MLEMGLSMLQGKSTSTHSLFRYVSPFSVDLFLFVVGDGELLLIRCNIGDICFGSG